MKRNNLTGVCLLLFFVICSVSCSHDDNPYKVETIQLTVSGHIGAYHPRSSVKPLSCMLVKEENEDEVFTLHFNTITDFVYEKGYSYVLSVEKTSSDKPSDKHSYILYKLIEIISCKKEAAEYQVKTLYKIEADDTSLIEADLHNNPPVPIDGGYLLSDDHETISILDKDHNALSQGTIQILQSLDIDLPFPEFYKSLIPEENIVQTIPCNFIFGEKIYRYDIHWIYSDTSIIHSACPWLCEDLTTYYRAKYPEAGVKGVLRIQILTHVSSSAN